MSGFGDPRAGLEAAVADVVAGVVGEVSPDVVEVSYDRHHAFPGAWTVTLIPERQEWSTVALTVVGDELQAVVDARHVWLDDAKGDPADEPPDHLADVLRAALTSDRRNLRRALRGKAAEPPRNGGRPG